MKKKLLIVTGAGASLEFGMPSVKDIDKLFEKWSLEILPLKSNNKESLYTWIKDNLYKYVKQNLRNRIENIMNFENLLYTIQTLYTLSNDLQRHHFNYRLNPFVKIIDFPEVIYFDKSTVVEGHHFSFLHSYLIDKLLEYFREKCKALKNDRQDEIKLLNSFFKEIKTQFEIGFINLNYDNVVLSTLPDLDTGFEKQTGKFNRSLLYDTKKWNFCYHIHGSVHFDMQGGEDNTEMHKICWNNDLFSNFQQNSSGRNLNNYLEGIYHLNSNIITGLDKTNQLLREPFASYYMQLDRIIYEADSILFIGYGFNDKHLNSIFPFIRYDKNKIRKVVIIDWASDEEDGISYRHDAWSHNLLQTLPTNQMEIGDKKDKLHHPVIFFKKRNKLEISRNSIYPLGIWYNGVLEACKNPNNIINELV